MSEDLDIDSFLGHGDSKGGGGFTSWKKDGKITVWLHPRANITALYFHNWYRPDTGDTDDGEENPLTQFRLQRLNCIESPRVIDKQRFRNKDGTREHPPVICPHCLLIEWIRGQVEAGKLDWTKPVFRFGDENARDAIVLHAGGITGMFGKKELTPKEKASLRAAGIRQDEVFKERGLTDLNYVFSVVDDQHPDRGAQISVEKRALGDKMKKVISGRMADLGKEEGNPKLNPVAFQLSYDEEANFSDRYDVIARTKIEVTDEVQAAFDQEPPDISRLTAKPDWGAYRAMLEQHALIDMPFEEFFEPLEEQLGHRIDAAEEKKSEDSDEDDDDLSPEWGGKSKAEPKKEEPKDSPKERVKKPKRPTYEENPDVYVGCDVCKKPMHQDDMQCPHCNAEYEEVNGDIVLKQKPKARSRSSK